MKFKFETSDGRVIAYAGLLVGSVASIAGNVAHAYVPPSGAPDKWSPPTGLVLSAIVWPIILFIAIEAMLRIPWPKIWYFALVRWGGLSVVAFVAGYISYQHMSGLFTHWGYGALTTPTPVGVVLNAADLGPFAVDGLMVMCAGALLALRVAAELTSGPVTVTDEPDLTSTKQTGQDWPDDATVQIWRDELPDFSDLDAALHERQTSTDVGQTPNDQTPDDDDELDANVADLNDRRSRGRNAQLILTALASGPATVSDLSTRTGVKRTTVSYVLKQTLAGRVRQDGRTWRLTSVTDEEATT